MLVFKGILSFFISSVEHKRTYFEGFLFLCLFVCLFFGPLNESKWSLKVFWTPLTFIICKTVEMFLKISSLVFHR